MFEVDDEDSGEETHMGPVTIWIGVSLDITSATAAHDAAQEILALLSKNEIVDVDIDFRGSIYRRHVGPVLVPPVNDLDPLLEVVSPINPALGLYISTRVRPNAQGTMAVYLAEGGKDNRLLGLSCRHVLISPEEPNTPVTWRPNAPSRDVLLLSGCAFNKFVDFIKLKARKDGIIVEYWNRLIERLKRQEAGGDTADATRAMASRIKAERLVTEAEEAMEAPQTFLKTVDRKWRTINNRVLGPILYCPPISLGVGNERFTEDWGMFQIDRAKLGTGFQGNVMDLGTNMTLDEFTCKCFPRDDANWSFTYPNDRLLPLVGTITDQQMHHPDMFDSNHEPCLLVVKSGNSTGTTIGRANGVFSVVREYYAHDMNINQTSMEWGIFSYSEGSGVFSEPGDSGSIIADIKGRIGGMLTGGSGTDKVDMTYATPFWWLLERIKANFPDAHLGVDF
ncbi:hypothetical protein SERLA73DRAFT_191106 [Serpula lacrymans var. lacrymans S7.3]|uniref:Peptidase S1 domain-containing protein n=2 Tax=Serpula lacrymans var. lacrymans TaxID=341189 RepID=F8QGX4_SERL3|nr:uncharacterized protein SERLADRAFT_480705 [Serpula lacrymans var. lacrymans S7.9]EGN92456.1 hypothetical protein SERLA73DRAFT_191106 [Serpula lacrymans var. lacrymans S7.3]EGO18583.1 hypothetical protein SERLADRAFT_480705 [Serpula lacrymans var. lacrymans S7.9]